MQNFNYRKAKSVAEASADFRFLGGGTTLIDLMKLEVETPHAVLDVTGLPLAEIKQEKDALLVGATVRNSTLAHNDLVKKNFPVLSQALLAGASPQLRNKATTAGNLLQRTRCIYFRDVSKPCNKRTPKSGCAAIEGHNRNLAILGTSDSCLATNPSDMNVAMMALEAKVQIENSGRKREVEIAEFYLLPGNTPDKEHVLGAGDLITGVRIPNLPASTKSTYLKLRDRQSYEFALASAAVVVTMSGGKISRARIAMGGIGTKPWRMTEVETALEGQQPADAVFQTAAQIAVKDAKPRRENGFKVELAKLCLIQALKTVTA